MSYIYKNIQNPAAEYLFKLQLIVSNTEYKNREMAAKYETLESKKNGEEYVRAVLKTDQFDSYQYDGRVVYQCLIDNGIPEKDAYKYLKNPYIIPPKIKNILLDQAREVRIATFKEKNKYYCNLAGIPFEGNDTITADRIVTVPDEFFQIYATDGKIVQNQPIHTMPPEYQELFMNSKYYNEILAKFPDEIYLRYIGSNAIPIEVSRKTIDGNIMRINTNKLSAYHKIFGNVTVSPDIIHLYTNTYKSVRDYVYNTLRGDFASIYPNYNNFIRFLTIYMSIGQSLNLLMKKSSSMAYMNNTTANNFFILYGLPSVIMEGQSMISFLKKLRLLLMDKGTNTVYRVKDYIGYKYTDIYTLVMVKQQVFEKGVPKYLYDSDGNRIPVTRLVFRRLGTTTDNTSYFKFRESNVEYDWQSIASGDPRWWWNTPEVEDILTNMNYTLSNSKYIQLSTHMSMNDIYWQCIIFLRGLLDNRKSTQFTKLSINYDLGGEADISVFDAVLTLVILMNWHTNTVKNRTFNGELFYNNGSGACLDLLFNGLMDDGLTPNELKLGHEFKLSSFNFNIRNTDPNFYNSLSSYDYLEPNIFIEMLDKVLDGTTKSVGQLIMDDTRDIYNFLIRKLLGAKTIQQYRQVTDVFNHLFLVEPIRTSWFDRDDSDNVKILTDMYDITYYDLTSLMNFYLTNDDVLNVSFNDKIYPIDISDILNDDSSRYSITIDGVTVYPFQDDEFFNAFKEEMSKYISNDVINSNLSNSIKNQYQNIIVDKVALDLGTIDNTPKSYESLLFRHNNALYKKLLSIKSEGSNLVLLMRAIVKALETYSMSDLSALEFAAIGEKDYMNILKEVISYFKSYMVEFTKDEFIHVMDGVFDNGGNSNMLKLFDEITRCDIDLHVTDSLTLYDVSNSESNEGFGDKSNFTMNDEAIIRPVTTYAYLKSLGYDIWFDDGNRITKNEPSNITDESVITANMVQDNSTSPVSYKIIIPIENIEN